MQNYFIQLQQLLFNKQKRKDILLDIAGEKFNLDFLKVTCICLSISIFLTPIIISQRERSKHFIFIFKDPDNIYSYISLIIIGFMFLFNIFIVNSLVLNFIIWKLKITKMNIYQLINIFFYLSTPIFTLTLFIIGIFLIFNLSLQNLLMFIPKLSILIFFIVFILAISLLRKQQRFLSIFLKYLIIITTIMIQWFLTTISMYVYIIITGFSL